MLDIKPPFVIRELIFYVVYDHPKDYPHEFVVRKFTMSGPTQEVETYDSLFEARKKLKMNGYFCAARHQTDDPVIVETWF